MAVSGSGTRRARGGLYGILTLLFAAAVLLCLWLVTALRISYTFVDGSAVIRLRSYQRSIPLAMEEAGIRLGYADEYSAYGSAGQITVRILRSVCVTLEVDGEKSIYTSTGRCVGDLLKQAGIELYAEDILDCDVTDPLSDGMHIKITTVRDSYSGCTLPVAARVFYVNNPSELPGTNSVILEGSCGEQLISYRDRYVSGKFAGRTVTGRITVRPSSDRVIETGTGEQAGSYIYMADGRVRALPAAAKIISGVNTDTEAIAENWESGGDEGDPDAD